MEFVSLEEFAACIIMVVIAATLAMIGHAQYEPKTPWTREYWKVHFSVFAGGLISGGLAAWIFGYDPLQPDGFVAVLGVAGSGYLLLIDLLKGGKSGA